MARELAEIASAFARSILYDDYSFAMDCDSGLLGGVV